MGYEIAGVFVGFSAKNSENRMICEFCDRDGSLLFLCGIDDNDTYRFMDNNGKLIDPGGIYYKAVLDAGKSGRISTKEDAFCILIHQLLKSAKTAAMQLLHDLIRDIEKPISNYVEHYSELRVKYARLSNDIDILLAENYRLRCELNKDLRLRDKKDMAESNVVQKSKKRLRSRSCEINIEARNRRKQYERTSVYLMRHTNGLVKIGHAVNPKTREKTLQAEDPRLHLIGSFPADAKTEKRLHEIFADLRVRGEWFRLEDRHVDWILALKPRKAKRRKRKTMSI